MTKKLQIHHGRKGAALAIRVTPRATKDEIQEIQSDGMVRIRLAASGKDDDINTALLVFLAKVLGVDISQVEIVAGQEGLDKLVSILDMEPAVVQKKVIGNLS